jgi:hypothetical protein
VLTLGSARGRTTGAGARAERCPLGGPHFGAGAPDVLTAKGSTVAITQTSLGRSRALLEGQDREVHQSPHRPVTGPWNASAAAVLRVCLHARL